MENYARKAVTEGTKSPEDIHIVPDSDIYRVLNLHYNRNNHIEVSQDFVCSSSIRLNLNMNWHYIYAFFFCLIKIEINFFVTI